jgi:UDP-N-acetylglucosamine diphosphorylase/glucosamine-1-phosphate N-acetyltransferase
MPQKTLIVAVITAPSKFVDADVGGHAARDCLLENLAGAEGTELVVANGKTAAELNAKIQPGADTLVVDGTVWFPRGTLARAVQRGRKARSCLKIVAPTITRRGDEDARTLAVYFPSGALVPGALKKLLAKSPAGLEQLLSPALRKKARRVSTIALDPIRPVFRVDSYAAVAELEKEVLRSRAERALAQGVRIRDPRSVYIRGTLECGSAVEIEVGVIFEGHVVLGDGVKVGAHSIVRNSRIGASTQIHPFSIVDGSTVGANGFVGPYGRIRPGSVIGDRVQIGNYVEIKSSRIGDGGRINHHTFIGDAILEEQVTIGAGSITCNHDGVGTTRTHIERGAYIGSGCKLVAPLRVGEGATIGAGSTVTRDVPAAKLTLARAQQVVVEGWQGPKTKRK